MLNEKVAIVTGAGSGIGRSVSLAYAENGARVVVSDIDEDGGKATVEQIKKAGGEAFFFKADVSSAAQNKALVEMAVREYGALHIACNNAGIGGAQNPVADYPVDAWDQMIKVNLSSVFYGMHYQIPEMLKVGGGAIVNMASILGKVGFEGACGYVAAKHGMIGLTKNAALEYSAQGIRVNAVGPGFIETPMLTKNLSEEQLGQIKTLHPIGRLGSPQEVAELVLWLSSQKSSFVTGAYYPIDGGYLAR